MWVLGVTLMRVRVGSMSMLWTYCRAHGSICPRHKALGFMVNINLKSHRTGSTETLHMPGLVPSGVAPRRMART